MSQSTKTGVVIIDYHEKGFPNASFWIDVPSDAAEEWSVPDGYKTGSHGQDLTSFKEQCRKTWPNAEIRCYED